MSSIKKKKNIPISYSGIELNSIAILGMFLLLLGIIADVVVNFRFNYIIGF